MVTFDVAKWIVSVNKVWVRACADYKAMIGHRSRTRKLVRDVGRYLLLNIDLNPQQLWLSCNFAIEVLFCQYYTSGNLFFLLVLCLMLCLLPENFFPVQLRGNIQPSCTVYMPSSVCWSVCCSRKGLLVWLTFRVCTKVFPGRNCSLASLQMWPILLSKLNGWICKYSLVHFIDVMHTARVFPYLHAYLDEVWIMIGTNVSYC